MAIAFVRSEILYAWKGPVLLVTDPRGECGRGQPLTGFYYREARFLRTFRVEINGHAPWLCEAAAVRPDLLEFTYVYPEITGGGGGGTGQSGDEEVMSGDGLPERSLDITVSYTLRAGILHVVTRVTNRARQPLTFEAACVIDSDFADIQEAQFDKRQQEAPIDAVTAGGRVEFRYGHPELPYRTSIECGGWDGRDTADPERRPFDAGETAHAFPGRLTTRLHLASQQTRELSMTVIPFVGDEAPSDADVAAREETLDRWRSAFTRIAVPRNRLFESILDANVRDIASFPLLDGPRAEWLAMQAGMPAYPAFFGRDAVTAGWQAGLLDGGDALDAALTRLARMQSDRVDDWRDEQPGRIPYQMRTGPLALLNINPYSAYYADFASPLMFVVSLANLYAWTGDRERVRRFWDAARRILDWARDYGDADGDGYLEYRTRSSKGTKNQGWKDSGDAIVYDDGSPVPAPIATCELQGYWYIAQELMGVLALALNSAADARAYWRSAADLKARFNRDWWVEQEQFFAVALDPDKRPVGAVTSNVGHCVATGIIDRDHLPAVVGRMFAPDLFSGWGVRTLSSAHAFYNPLSYHRGSVWAVEQGTIVFGLRRFGFDARARDLTRALFDLAALYPEYRIPECVGGYARGSRATPAAYPRANTPQLWNATAFPLVVQTLLGLLPLAPINTLIVDPVLPTWMPDMVLRDLRVGQAKVSLRFWRDEDGGSRWEVLHKSGTLRIVRQPPPESLTAGVSDRLRALLQTAV
jgi:glycogen debranching enzyme